MPLLLKWSCSSVYLVTAAWVARLKSSFSCLVFPCLFVSSFLFSSTILYYPTLSYNVLNYPLLSCLLLLLLELLPCTSRSTARAFKTAAESSDASSAALIAGKSHNHWILHSLEEKNFHFKLCTDVYDKFFLLIMRIIFTAQSVHVGEVLEVHLKAGIHSGNLLSICITHVTLYDNLLCPWFSYLIIYSYLYFYHRLPYTHIISLFADTPISITDCHTRLWFLHWMQRRILRHIEKHLHYW